MELQCEEIIRYEVISEDGKHRKEFNNIDDVIAFIRAIKYSEVRKISKLIFE